jgi:hypothetical protein
LHHNDNFNLGLMVTSSPGIVLLALRAASQDPVADSCCLPGHIDLTGDGGGDEGQLGVEISGVALEPATFFDQVGFEEVFESVLSVPSGRYRLPRLSSGYDPLCDPLLRI